MSHFQKTFIKIILPLCGILIQVMFNNLATAEVIKLECDNMQNAFNKRLCVEQHISDQPFVLIPYKPNYFIGSYVDGLSKTNPDFDNFETKFQISFKIPLSNYKKGFRCLWIDDTRCYSFFGYTQISVWQMLNFDQSAPFRDTNFEPELIVAQIFNTDLLAGWSLRMINYGIIDHQSNGKTPPFSRSWNRSYFDIVTGNGNNYITFKYWKRWSETQKLSPTDFKGDDNPFIEDFVGNVELKYFYASEGSNYSVVMRDSKNNSSKVNYELNWSYPIDRMSIFGIEDSDLRFYVQYFNGFGETLIDYNVKRERLGIGIMLTDWL